MIRQVLRGSAGNYQEDEQAGDAWISWRITSRWYDQLRDQCMIQLVKNPLAMWETWVQALGWEDPLEKGKAAHSSILP